MITLVYISLLLAIAGAFGVMCYSRHIPKSISAMVYDYKKGFQWAWSAWLIAIGALLLVPMMEALDDRLCVFGFLTFAFIVGTAVTPLVNRETSDWHDWFGICAGMFSQCVVAIINPAWYLAWGLYVACLPFKAMRPYYVLVSEICCSITIFGSLIEFYGLKKRNIMNWYLILAIAIYIVFIVIAYGMMKEWKHPKWQKVIFAVFWPLPAVLYAIHWLHKKL